MRSDCVAQPLSPQAAPQPTKKSKTRARQSKVTGVGLEDFLDETRLVDRKPVGRKKCLALPWGLLHEGVDGLRP